MLAQGLHGGVLASQFVFSEQGMNLAVADAVQHCGLAPALALGHQVVQVALCRRNAPVAQRASQGRLFPRVQEAGSCRGGLCPDIEEAGSSVPSGTILGGWARVLRMNCFS